MLSGSHEKVQSYVGSIKEIHIWRDDPVFVNNTAIFCASRTCLEAYADRLNTTSKGVTLNELLAWSTALTHYTLLTMGLLYLDCTASNHQLRDLCQLKSSLSRARGEFRTGMTVNMSADDDRSIKGTRNFAAVLTRFAPEK